MSNATSAVSDQFEIPRIISVDDHVVEPPDLWTSRLPAKMQDRAPRVVRDRASVNWRDGNFTFERGGSDGTWCDWWEFGDVQMAFTKIFAAVGFDRADIEPTTYNEIHPGAWKQSARLADMTADHIDASMCFPNMFSRFAGQTFSQTSDRELGLACVQAYNDWILEEWTAGEGRGRLIPLVIIPFWDVDLAVREAARCARNGAISVSFSENPYQLGYPTIHSGYWDPLFGLCSDENLTLTMHIGSSSKMPVTSPDAPVIVSSILHSSVTAGSMFDFVFSGVLDRFPELRLFYAESQAGWMPYVLEQADWLWHKREGLKVGSDLPRPPSAYIKERVWTSIFNDTVALRNRDILGMSQICFETDYPHSVTTFPNTQEVATKFCADAGLTDAERYALLRGNAIKALGLERIGITR